MVGIKKFKTFKEADRYAMGEYCRGVFDPARTGKFFRELDGRHPNPYRPGLYRFKSFEDARRYDIEKLVENSVKGRGRW